MFGDKKAIIAYIKATVTNKVYRNGGITWTQNGKTFHVEDIPEYNQEQIEQINKFGEIFKGSKKPANGWKREVDIIDS